MVGDGWGRGRADMVGGVGEGGLGAGVRIEGPLPMAAAPSLGHRWEPAGSTLVVSGVLLFHVPWRVVAQRLAAGGGAYDAVRWATRQGAARPET